MVYLWAFLIGVGSCFIYIPALTTVQRWYPARKGLVSGIVNMMFALSAAIMSPLFVYMVRVMGYFSMNIVAGVFALAIGGVAAQFTESPERLGREKPEARMDEESKKPSLASVTVKESIRMRSFWFLWLTWAFQGAAGISMVTLSVTFGLSKGLAIESAVVILTVFNIMSGLSRLFMGYLSDTIGRNSTMSIAFLAAGLAYFALPYIESLAVSATLAAIIGLAFGTLFAVSAPLAADCFGLRHFGAILGLVFTAYGFVSGVLGPSLSGYVLDITDGNFMIVFTYLGSFCLLSGVLIRFVVPPQSK